MKMIRTMRTLTLFSTGPLSTVVPGFLHAMKRNGEKSGTYSGCEFGDGFEYQGCPKMRPHTYSGLEQKPIGK